MGQSAEKMAKENGITREAQDRLALMSHQRAAAATADGRLAAEIAPWFGGPGMDQIVTADNGIRADTSLEALAPAPAGVRPALRLGHRGERLAAHRRRRRRAAHGRGQGGGAGLRAARLPAELRRGRGGSRLAAPHGAGVRGAARARARRASRWSDLGLVEIHEAFAAQVLSNVQAWGSPAWAERLGLAGPGGRGGLGAHQRDGRLDRDRPSVRRHRAPGW